MNNIILSNNNNNNSLSESIESIEKTIKFLSNEEIEKNLELNDVTKNKIKFKIMIKIKNILYLIILYYIKF